MSQSCTAAELLSASKCLCGIPSDQREAVMIYLLQQLAGLGNLTAAQLLDRAKCLCGLSERDMKAIEVALLCTATGGVPPVPPCPPSGGCTYQDMQVAWTPSNLKLGEKFAFIAPDLGTATSVIFSQSSILGATLVGANLTSVSFPNLTQVTDANQQFRIKGANISTFSAPVLSSCANGLEVSNSSQLSSLALPALSTIGAGGLNCSNLDIVSSISFPSLVSIAANGIDIDTDPLLTSISFLLLSSVSGLIYIGSNASITAISLPSLATTDADIDFDTSPLLSAVSLPLWEPANGTNVIMPGCALSVASVNHILARCVANAGYVSGTVDLSGGTNAAPSGQGIADKATLIGRGVTVNTN